MNKLRVAKPGFNAFSETDLDNIIYDSAYDTLKYYTSGSVSLAVTGASIETTITHGLGYIPFFTAFCDDPINSTHFSMTPNTFKGFGLYSYINVYADNDKLYFRVDTNTLNATLTFYYKIFRNDTTL